MKKNQYPFITKRSVWLWIAYHCLCSGFVTSVEDTTTPTDLNKDLYNSATNQQQQEQITTIEKQHCQDTTSDDDDAQRSINSNVDINRTMGNQETKPITMLVALKIKGIVSSLLQRLKSISLMIGTIRRRIFQKQHKQHREKQDRIVQKSNSTMTKPSGSSPFYFPVYTSPPLDDAIQDTPELFRSDNVINKFRTLSANGQCDEQTLCQIPFYPKSNEKTFSSSLVGVILYGGAFIDPRSYSVLASRIVNKYNIPVVVPVFAKDISVSLTSCYTGRLLLAQKQFPNVQKWIFVGHSLGGYAAALDVWNLYISPQTYGVIGGLVLLAAFVDTIPPCAFLNFSSSQIPMSTVYASNDELLDITTYNERRDLVTRISSSNSSTSPDEDDITASVFVTVKGGTHRGFASYNATERSTILRQKSDGEQTTPFTQQWDITVDTIYSVAKRTGLSLPTIESNHP